MYRPDESVGKRLPSKHRIIRPQTLFKRNPSRALLGILIMIFHDQRCEEFNSLVSLCKRCLPGRTTGYICFPVSSVGSTSPATLVSGHTACPYTEVGRTEESGPMYCMSAFVGIGVPSAKSSSYELSSHNIL